jgi:murein DD-endopeptidase MepM/ murein hydrolase activator NlpD
MHRRHPRIAFTFVLASLAGAAFTMVGCSGPSDTLDVVTATEATDPHGDESGDMSTPNDDPSLGDLGEDDAAPSSSAADASSPSSGDAGKNADSGSAKPGPAPTPPPVKVAAPVPGKVVTYPYGVKNSRYAAGYHTGDDYAAAVGLNVVAVRSGTIRWSNDNGGAYGKWMGLDADNGRTYVYCHLSSRLVSAGKKVVAGQVLGKVGATGNVTGPHLHFEDHPLGPFVYAHDRKPAW